MTLHCFIALQMFYSNYCKMYWEVLDFKHCYDFSIVDFEQVNVGWQEDIGTKRV